MTARTTKKKPLADRVGWTVGYVLGWTIIGAIVGAWMGLVAYAAVRLVESL